MAFSFQIGETAIPAAHTVQTISVTGFTPKLVIIWGASGENTDHMRVGWGMGTSSTNRVARSVFSDHNVGTSDCRSYRSASHIVYFDGPAAADEAHADLDSLNDGNFKLDWSTTGADVEGKFIQWLAIGGFDISDASVSSFTAPSSTGVSNHADSNFNVGAPDLAVYMTGNMIASDTFPKERDHAVISIGVATGTDEEWCVAIVAKDAVTTTVTYKGNRDDKCVGVIDDGSEAWEYLGEHSAFTFAGGNGGHDVNWTTATSSSKLIDVMFVRGGDYKAGLRAEKTTIGLDSVVGAGFQGSCVLGMGTEQNNNVLDGDLRLTISAGSDTQNRFMWFGDEDNVGTTNCKSDKLDQMYRRFDMSMFLLCNFDLATMDSDGFTTNWDIAGADPNEWCYLIIGGVESMPSERGFSRGMSRPRGTF